ncbi:MAG: hypothetical protein WBA63_01975 [Thermomicrobiales bacterium]
MTDHLRPADPGVEHIRKAFPVLALGQPQPVGIGIGEWAKCARPRFRHA